MALEDVADAALVRYLAIRSPLYRGKLEEVADAISSWLEYVPATFPSYTRHTAHHSNQIIRELSRLLFRDASGRTPTVRLNGTEAYILCVAAYLHDAGMVVPDSDKISILSSDEWRDWVAAGPERRRRLGAISDAAVDHGIDDAAVFAIHREFRLLISEFLRGSHAERSRTHVLELATITGRLDLGDPVLRKTVADVCAGHGLPRRELEDDITYPDRRDVRTEPVNVRLLTILLRLGDLLDMSSDRACPLAMSAVSPLPPETVAHWTKYRGITHRLTAPDRIELVVACDSQDEDRLFRDWCTWLIDELEFAAVIVPRGRRHSDWRPPAASMTGSNPTITIRPAAGATYVARDWRIELDPESVIQRLVKDVYPETNAFIRELLQNAIDATRRALYDRLIMDNKSQPTNPSDVPHEMRMATPVRVELKWVETETDFGPVRVQQLTIEDHGVGMTEEVIERFLLQVGRSYYETRDFQQRYRFTPLSRFGIGFLSVFAESEQVVVTTRTDDDQKSLQLTLRGPRRYLLVDRTADFTHRGTKTEVRLNRALQPGELTSLIEGWCRKVEIPIIVRDLDVESTVLAERLGQFDVTVPREDGGAFTVRSFPINAPGFEGEAYVLASTGLPADDFGGVETWGDRDIAARDGEVALPHRLSRGQYRLRHPLNRVPDAPRTLFASGGITVFEEPGAPWHEWSVRLNQYGPPAALTLARRLRDAQPWADRDQLANTEPVRSLFVDILSKHVSSLAGTPFERSAYLQSLTRVWPITGYWENVAGTIRYYQDGVARYASIADVASFQDLDVFSRVVRRDGDRTRAYRGSPPAGLAVVDNADVNMADVFVRHILRERVPSRVAIDRRYMIATLSRANSSRDAIADFMYHNWHLVVCDFASDAPKPPFLFMLNLPRSDRGVGALNRDHPTTKWLLEVARESITGQVDPEPARELTAILAGLPDAALIEDSWHALIRAWRERHVSPIPGDNVLIKWDQMYAPNIVRND